MDPSGSAVLPENFRQGMLVYGEWVEDGVWYKGTVRSRLVQGRRAVEIAYEDGGVDLSDDLPHRRWRRL